MDHNLLVAARTEYTEKLQDILGEPIYKGIKDIFKECKDQSKHNTLSVFQKKLCEIPKWNQEIINEICKKAMTDSDISLEYLDKIIEAVFLSNIKILSVVKLNDNKETIDVNVPDTKNFIHRCYIESARRFYTDPYLVDDRETGSNTQQEIKRNVKRSNSVVKDSVEKTIRGMIPMEDILTKYLNSQNTTSASETSDPEPEPEQDPEPYFEQNTEQEPQFQQSYPYEEKTVDNIFQEEPVQNESYPQPVYENNPVETIFQQDPVYNQTQTQPQHQEDKLHIDLKEQEKHFFSDSE